MVNRYVLVAIALVVSLPVLFAVVGGGRAAGIAVGVVLVVGGFAYGIVGSRRSDP